MNDRRVKIGLFLGATFLASIFLGRAGGKFFAYSFFEFLGVFWEFLSKVILRLLFAGLAFSLPALFLTTAQRLLIAGLINGSGFFFGFWSVAGSQNLGSGLVLALLFVLCGHLFFKGVQARAKKFISFPPNDIFIPKVANLFFYLTLVFAFSFYLGLKGEIDRGEFVIPERVFEQVVGPVSQIFQKKLEEGIKKELGKSAGEEIGEEMGVQESEELLKEVQEEARGTGQVEKLLEEPGLELEVFDETKPLNLQELRRRVQEAIEPFLKYLPFLAASSLYFTLRIVIGFLFIFLPWLIPLMFRILIKLGVLKIVEGKEIIKRLSL